jgi:hypothetical protein
LEVIGLKKLLLLSVVLLCVVGLWAQEEEGGKALVYSGKIGIFRPSDSGLRDDVGSSWFLLGIDAESPVAPDASWVYSLEYLHKSGTNGTVTEIPLLVTWKKTSVSGEPPLFGEAQPRYYPYLGVGAGLYYLKAENGTSDSTWKTGFHILVGARFSSNMFAELRWNTISKWHDTDFGGYSLLVGIRF